MRDRISLHRPIVLRVPGRLAATISALLTLALLSGCGRSPVMVNKYLLEYPAPELPRRAPVTEGLQVELFATAQAFNSQAMVYRPAAYQSEVYRYHRWRVNPGNMVTDFLLRDLRQSGLFTAIFAYDSPARPRFVLEGAVEEFQEVNEGDVWLAVLAVNITLLDTTREEVTQRVLFQKGYRAEETLTAKTPKGLAEAMSRAMRKLSEEIISDTHRAAGKRQAAKGTG